MCPGTLRGVGYSRKEGMHNNDMLYQIFEKQLHDESADSSHDGLAIEVVSLYIAALRSQGVVVPTQLREVMESDLIEEVLEMIRKKTYGFHNIQDYRASQSKQKRRA